MAICNDQAIASSSIRLSFHESITDEDIDRLIEALEQTVILIKTKKYSPFWQINLLKNKIFTRN